MLASRAQAAQRTAGGDGGDGGNGGNGGNFLGHRHSCLCIRKQNWAAEGGKKVGQSDSAGAGPDDSPKINSAGI